MGNAEQKTGGAIKGGLVGNNPLLTAQRIVIRAWPSSWSENRWIIEAYAAEDCPVELAVLPASSPFGSVEAENLTRLLLSERGARIFSQGKRVLNNAMVGRTLRQTLDMEERITYEVSLCRAFDRAKLERERETAARIAEWKRRIEALTKEP